MKTYARSKEVAALKIEGKATQLANSLKLGVPLSFWYYIKQPCGGWSEFDIRDIEDLNEWTKTKQFEDLQATPRILPVLAKKLEAMQLLFEQLKFIPKQQPTYVPYETAAHNTDDLPF